MTVVVRPPEGVTAAQARDVVAAVCGMVEMAGHGACRPSAVVVWPVAEQRTLFP